MKNKDYYWCYMLNGGVCVKCYTFEEIDNAIICGRYRDAKRIKTITPDKVKLKVPRIKGTIKSKGYYQSYDLFERSLEGLRR